MTSKDYFTGSAALAAAPQTTKAGLFYRWDKEEEEKRKEEEKVREKREEEDGKKNVGNSDVQSVASLPYASSSKSPTLRNKAAGFKKKLNGKIFTKADDVAYGNALLSGASHTEAEAAAKLVREEQEAKYEEGVRKARELNADSSTRWSDRPVVGLVPMVGFASGGGGC